MLRSKIRLVELVRRVVLLVHRAGSVAAIHRLALDAPVVLLLLHAAAVILLDAVRVLRAGLGVLESAGIAEVLGAGLVGLGQFVVATRAGILLLLQGEVAEAESADQDRELHHS